MKYLVYYQMYVDDPIDIWGVFDTISEAEQYVMKMSGGYLTPWTIEEVRYNPND